ncbi:MAG: patatin-like phospholipase family protein [Syntrophaceae bacterium]|nr:patatin-like phospholipase family protein [Syntrophaceae bacterium]
MLVRHKLKIFIAIISMLSLLSACTPMGTQVKPTARPAKVALVLGAGASKGFAHIGVLKILETQKVPIHMVAGTSVGSFIGGIYAYGYNAYKLQSIAMSIEKEEVTELTLPDNGFVGGERLRSFVNTKVMNTPIEKFRIPFYAVATDIKTGEEVVFASGNAGMAIQASCSVPGVFQPARFSGRTYVDGGVVNPLPVDVARRYGADVVIAVDISSSIDRNMPASTLETILKSVDIMYEKISQAQIAKADVVIRPNVSFVGSADFTRRHDAILEGEKAALAAMPRINAILARLRQEGRLP